MDRRGWKALLIGRPLRNRELGDQRLATAAALSVLAPDALSSVAYGTEQILEVLVGISAAALWFALPISAAIVLLLAVLVISYRQVISAYPGGGGAYVIGRDCLGPGAGLVAGASLLVDYTLTIAVSVTAGTAALVSAFPVLWPYRLGLDLVLIAALTVVNLRGSHASATALAIPTFTFVALVLVLVSLGGARLATGGLGRPAALTPPAFGAISLFLVLRAFSSGSSALTGIEAISNGVPLFARPAVAHARQAMAALGILLGVMFLGTTVLAVATGAVPRPEETVLSSVAAAVFGRGPLYYILAIATTAILAVAANTSFAGFPQLASVMAADGYLPHLFLRRGDRLVHSNGILFVAAAAAGLVLLFGGSTTRLVPLYAIGVYAGFTISQVGLVLRRRAAARAGGAAPGDLARSGINALGAALTAIVVGVFTVTKFTEGAWIVLLVIPLLVLAFRRVHRHYAATAAELALPSLSYAPTPARNLVLVPVAAINRVVASTLGYAKAIGDDIIALHVSTSREESAALESRWAIWGPGVRLVTIESQYRSVVQPIMRYIDHLQARDPSATITVLIPEFVVGRWWQGILHNQMGLLLQARLVLRRDIVIAMVPYRLSGR